MTTVVNIRKEPYDVCIMRPSIYGNPFAIGRDGTREEVIEKFRIYFYERIKRDEAFSVAVVKLRDQRIGCCCAPLPCHGDIYAEFLDNPPEDKYLEGTLNRNGTNDNRTE